MSGIFISYRREDSIAYAGRLSDLLIDRFGEERIFMDIDTMKVGLDFVEQIEKAVQSCHVLIAVIGKTWVNIQDEEGKRRLDNPEDFVRVEIQTALERNILVIPLLVGGAGMPKATDLPDPIAKLARRHAMNMSDERFRADATRLIEQISEYVTKAESEPPPPPPKLEPTIPEGMVLIPKGAFLYGEKCVREDMPYDYYMDIYPVTNDQYKAFMLANGYASKNY
ncbi:MAG: TIR domain-containing protein [Nitrospira sp.]|nr:TIR domain-containing protein [Nitrospira sp.]